jgi:hypothetical protein
MPIECGNSLTRSSINLRCLGIREIDLAADAVEDSCEPFLFPPGFCRSHGVVALRLQTFTGDAIRLPLPSSRRLSMRQGLAVRLEPRGRGNWRDRSMREGRHMRLCYSRVLFLVAYPRESQEMVFDAHAGVRFPGWRTTPAAGREKRSSRWLLPCDGDTEGRPSAFPTWPMAQAALTLIMEPILAADFQPGSYGYARGKMTRNVVPVPGEVSSSRLASSNSQRRLTIERPMPSPAG